MSIAENHGGLYRNLKLLRESNGKAERNYFRALGFDYLYVERGNDVGSLIEAFRKVKDIDHPVVVHIHTEKGHGYAPAVADKERWHWSMPFHLEDGSPLNPSHGGKSMDMLLGDWLFEEMKRDEKLVAITAAREVRARCSAPTPPSCSAPMTSWRKTSLSTAIQPLSTCSVPASMA